MESTGKALIEQPVYKGAIPYIPNRKQVIELASADCLFFNHYFFPRAYRQEDPPFERKVWALLEHPDHRYVGFEMFRGAAKTTRLRTFMAKRVAFALSHTILYIGKSDEHATRSVSWLRKQILYNSRFTDVFGLSKGMKFSEGTLEIEHGIDGRPVYVTGVGITGSIRGINFDDYRPDLIILDDIIDQESVHTPQARKKIRDLVHGDIKKSLEARTDNPNAKMVLLGTPLDADDPGQEAKKDPEWVTVRISCWTPETEDLPIDQQVSSWPARYPSLDLQREKRAAIATNRLYLFVREMECKLISPETASFKSEWLKTYDVLPPWDEIGTRIMWIDPVPPPSENEIKAGLAKKDFEAFAVVGLWKGDFYILEIRSNRGHQPDWTVKTFFELIHRWHPREIRVEGVAYQRTLKWILDQAMQEKREYHAVRVDDYGTKRSKHDKIVDGLLGPASQGRVFYHPSMSTFKEQYDKHPQIAHDDELEAVARAVEHINLGAVLEDETEEQMDEGSNVVAIANWRQCP